LRRTLKTDSAPSLNNFTGIHYYDVNAWARIAIAPGYSVGLPVRARLREALHKSQPCALLG
jgi:hypothetical protein